MNLENKTCEALILLHLAEISDSDEEKIKSRFDEIDLDQFHLVSRDQSAWVGAMKSLQKLNLENYIDPSWPADFRALEKKHLSKNQWLKKLLAAFSRENISLIPLKGGLLGATIYQDSLYKKMNDFDFLTPRKEAHKVLGILQEIGFLSLAERIGQKDDLERSHHTYPFYSPDLNCVLGLHWNLVGPGSSVKIGESLLWRQPLTPIVLGDLGPCHRLSWEWHLLHLCVHLPFYKTGVRELADVFNLILFAQPVVNWSSFVEIVHQTNAEANCFRVLSLTKALFKDREIVPDFVLQACQSKTLQPVIQDTNARALLQQGLILKRSTLPAKIEKAFALSILSKDYKVRRKAWLASWVLCFFPPKTEAVKIELSGSQLKTSWQVLKLLMKDHGAVRFWALTFWNMWLVLKWSAREVFSKNPRPTQKDLETLELLKSLE